MEQGSGKPREDLGPRDEQGQGRVQREERAFGERMAAGLVRRMIDKVQRGPLKAEWRKEKKKNMETLERIEAGTARLGKIGINIGCLANAHQVIDENIQDLHIRMTQAQGGQEGEKARGEEWKTLQDQMNDIWERMEEEEQEENLAIWERGDLQEAALESAKRVRAIGRRMGCLRGGDTGREEETDSDIEPEDWESREEEECEKGHPDADWEECGGRE